MHTIQIPGSRDRQHPDDVVGHACQVVLKFSEPGDFSRSREGDSFTPHGMFQGHANAGDTPSSSSPTRDLTVHWTFRSQTGETTSGKVIVKRGADCKDPKEPDDANAD